MRACVVTVGGMRTAREPVVAVAFATPDARDSQVAPLSTLISMFTSSPVARLCVQVTVRVDPAPQVTAVLGAVTVTRGLMVKLTSLTSNTLGVDTQRARIRAWVVGGPVTSQARLAAV